MGAEQFKGTASIVQYFAFSLRSIAHSWDKQENTKIPD